MDILIVNSLLIRMFFVMFVDLFFFFINMLWIFLKLFLLVICRGVCIIKYVIKKLLKKNIYSFVLFLLFLNNII